MDLKFTHGFIILVITASVLSVSIARKDSSFGLNYWWQPREIIVGDSQLWRFGYNYTDWAIKTAPFHPNDVLVFKYDAPNATTFPHNVYQFADYKSFLNCDLKNAKELANETQGGGEGFKFVLYSCEPYFFACGEKNGFHCSNGTMKFSVKPVFYQ